MNLSDWMYHLTLRTALHPTGFVEPHPASARPPRERARSARRAAIVAAALLAPVLRAAVAVLGG